MKIHLEIESDDPYEDVLRRRLFDVANELMAEGAISGARVGRGQVNPPEGAYWTTDVQLRWRQADAIRFAAGQAGKISLAGRSTEEFRSDVVHTVGNLADAVRHGEVKVP